MNLIKAITFGILIWVLMFAIVSAVLGFYQKFLWVKIAVAIVAGIIAFVLAGKAKPTNFAAALGYGFIWVLIGLILDYLITRNFNAQIFTLWSVWLGYGLIFIAPIFRIKKQSAQI